jgi:hypothetical protein
MPAAVWAMSDVGTAVPGDRRRARRVATLLSDRAARPGDGEPGGKVLGRGLSRLEALTLGWHLATASPASSRRVGNG